MLPLTDARLGRTERQGGVGGKLRIGTVAGQQAVVPGRGNHGGIVSGEAGGREEDRESARFGRRGKALAQHGITGHAAGDQNGFGCHFLGGSESSFNQVRRHSILEACDEVQCGE